MSYRLISWNKVGGKKNIQFIGLLLHKTNIRGTCAGKNSRSNIYKNIFVKLIRKASKLIRKTA
jgi:hypothetical protein